MKFLARLILCLMISFSLTEFPIMKAQAHAGMITTKDALTQMTRAEGEKSVSEFLNRTEVKDQLVKIGITPEEANRRLAGLSDAEVRKLASDIDTATLGGDVTGILVLVLVVVMIIYFAKRI